MLTYFLIFLWKSIKYEYIKNELYEACFYDDERLTL